MQVPHSLLPPDQTMCVQAIAFTVSSQATQCPKRQYVTTGCSACFVAFGICQALTIDQSNRESCTWYVRSYSIKYEWHWRRRDQTCYIARAPGSPEEIGISNRLWAQKSGVGFCSMRRAGANSYLLCNTLIRYSVWVMNESVKRGSDGEPGRILKYRIVISQYAV